DLWDAVHHMRRHGIRRLPVVNAQGGLEGILTLDDALELISEALSDLVGLITREGAREKSTRPAR
ncbi:MAG: CBS domain-containing protein, partial [Pseudomonadales bacterium]